MTLQASGAIMTNARRKTVKPLMAARVSLAELWATQRSPPNGPSVARRTSKNPCSLKMDTAFQQHAPTIRLTTSLHHHTIHQPLAKILSVKATALALCEEISNAKPPVHWIFVKGPASDASTYSINDHSTTIIGLHDDSANDDSAIDKMAARF